MLELICFFGPACLAMLLFISANKEKEIPLRQYVAQYGIYVTLINGFTFLVLDLVFGHKDAILNISQSSIGFIEKYLLIGIIFSVIIAVLIQVISQKISFKLEVTKKEKRIKKQIRRLEN